MKLLITQPYLNLKGGAERVLLKIAQHYDAKILTVEYDKEKAFPEFKDLDVHVVKRDVPFSSMLPYRAAQGMLAGYTFYNMKIREDYDVLNSHTSPSEWIRHKNERVLWYCHTPIREVYDLYELRMKNRSYKQKALYFAFTSAYKMLSKDVIRDIEEIATNSENTNSRIRKYFGRSAQIINPGVDIKEFRNDGDEKYFFYPSRFYINKRQDYVIDAFMRFQKRTGLTNYKLILAGSLSNDKEHIEYFERLKKMSAKNVIFKLSPTDKEIRDWYAGATAVLFAAVNEDYGIVPIEAMASGKVLISVNEGGPRETMVDGKTGFLVNSSEEMAEKMKFVVEHGAIAEKMGKEASRHAKNYTWDAFFKKFDILARKVSKM
ncbi:MAG: glycosyltransferase [Candidatus Micrarchaeota archaeon]|nr:glycosyltransferase [Candidatus Micrarchaeota archaeon]MDE1804709.1 glycosyltransferase [Candidatus Micrarchaeota archaeon]MDE1847135.1 glycosyltransferase [Candidatus Micrarchaeota archaeon]